MEEEAERELYESYSAQCLWTIAGAVSSLGGGEFTIPQYVDMIHPEHRKPEKKLTTKEIKQHILKRLWEG